MHLMKSATAIATVLEKFPNLIITMQNCPYCHKAKDILKNMKIDFHEIERSHDLELTKQFQEAYSYRTYPMVFLKKEFIKGHSDLKKLLESGELAKYRDENKENL